LGLIDIGLYIHTCRPSFSDPSASSTIGQLIQLQFMHLQIHSCAKLYLLDNQRMILSHGWK